MIQCVQEDSPIMYKIFMNDKLFSFCSEFWNFLLLHKTVVTNHHLVKTSGQTLCEAVCCGQNPPRVYEAARADKVFTHLLTLASIATAPAIYQA